MKKVLAIAALGMITLASCKKDYTCTCTASDADYNSSTTWKDIKKKDAEKACDQLSTTMTIYAGGKCELK